MSQISVTMLDIHKIETRFTSNAGRTLEVFDDLSDLLVCE